MSSVPVRQGGSWQNANAVWTRSGGTWREWIQAWIRHNGDWRLFADWNIPTGPQPTMVQPSFDGGPVEQSWSNPGAYNPDDYQILITLYVNSSPVATQVFSSATTFFSWPAGHFSGGNSVQSSVTYRVHPGLSGAEGPLSTAITYFQF